MGLQYFVEDGLGFFQMVETTVADDDDVDGVDNLDADPGRDDV
jgi:hypothetical protein